MTDKEILLEPHQEEILKKLYFDGNMSPEEYSHISSRSLAELELDFEYLVKLGFLEEE